MGMARHCEKFGDFKTSIEVTNKLIVNSPSFIPALVEKMRLLLTLGEWEQSFETATRILSQKDEKNIDALAQVPDIVKFINFLKNFSQSCTHW